jgi:hypothetical protein
LPERRRPSSNHLCLASLLFIKGVSLKVSLRPLLALRETFGVAKEARSPLLALRETFGVAKEARSPLLALRETFGVAKEARSPLLALRETFGKERATWIKGVRYSKES